MDRTTPSLSRRELNLLALSVATPLAATLLAGHTAGIVLAQDGGTPEADATPVLAPTPSCGDGDLDQTVAQTEGPYFKPDSPERANLVEPGMSGNPLLVTGYVYSADCKPVAKALLDFWHADDAGVYDNEGFRLRGHQFTDADGRYELGTILPGIYTGRTRHIHVNVQAENGGILTTQLYFPDEPGNDADGIFDSRLVMDIDDAKEEEIVGYYTFVLPN